MPDESGVIICPNPNCHGEIKEPILLNNLSTTPAEQYYACPHCLIKLDMETENEEDVIEESAPSPPMHPSLEKVLDVISAEPRKEKEKKKKEQEPSVKPSNKEGKGPSACPYHFGYLASRPKRDTIPEECLICPKVMDCVLKS